MGKSIAIVAIKGGVGKTTVTQNLANIYSIFEPTLILDSDKSPMTHLEFKTRIKDKYIADVNGEGIDWITQPNLLDFQKDYEDNEILIKNTIKKIEDDQKFKNLKKAEIAKMANEKAGKLNLLNYVTWIDDSSDFGILGGGLDEVRYEALSKNHDLINKLNEIKDTWNVLYDTQAGEHDLTFKLMDNAEKIILVSNIGAGAHVNASRMGSLYLWHKLEKSISRDKKNISELLKLTHVDSVNNTNYKHIEEKVRRDLAEINDESIKSVFNWYIEKIDKAKKETELYVLLNMVPQKGKKIGGESAETVAKWCYAQLKDAFEKNGIRTYHLGTLHESPAYRANAINRGIIPRIDFKKKRSLWDRIIHPMDPLYKECYEIVEKIMGGEK